jgi:hypothetical protein
MTRRSAARLVAATLLGLSVAGAAHAARFGGGGGHVGGFSGFHGGARFHGGLHTRVFIGGALFAPFFWLLVLLY